MLAVYTSCLSCRMALRATPPICGVSGVFMFATSRAYIVRYEEGCMSAQRVERHCVTERSVMSTSAIISSTPGEQGIAGKRRSSTPQSFSRMDAKSARKVRRVVVRKGSARRRARARCARVFVCSQKAGGAVSSRPSAIYLLCRDAQARRHVSRAHIREAAAGYAKSGRAARAGRALCARVLNI